MQRTFNFAHLIGEGIGPELAQALYVLLDGLGLDYNAHKIENFRLADRSLDPAVIEIFRDLKIGIKGPTRTETGRGARSLNVALRQELDLFVNLRPVSYFEGVDTPVKHPELLDTVVFRENTEDLYAGIEWESGSAEAIKLINFLRNEMHVPENKLPYINTTGIGIKPTSEQACKRLAKFAIDYMLEHGRKNLGIVHKGNIMKYTEGLFMEMCYKVATEDYFAQLIDPKNKVLRIVRNGVKLTLTPIICDDSLQQLLLNPVKFDGAIMLNLNGDYYSDAAAGQVGGAALSPGGNIGDQCALFEAIGGTADAIAGMNKVNPTAFFLAGAMMLGHAGFTEQAQQIRKGIVEVLKSKRGTFDVCKSNPLSTTQFTEAVIAEALEYA